MKEKTRDVLCLLAMLIACLAAAGLWVFSVQTQPSRPVMQYPQRLFDDSRVHHIDLQTGDWQQLLQQAQEEEYIPCTVVIDGEEFLQVAVRAKGNNSLRLTQQYGLSRYSLKLEFDHYLEGGHYYGLDKFSLDAFFQDNSAMKTRLTMDLMSWMGVPTPLCSYVWVTINGEDWGLFLAIEEPEESFLRRVYGDEEVHLYKPDYRSLQADNADVALQYLGDDPQNYPNIFDHAKTMASEADQRRLIQALRRGEVQYDFVEVMACPGGCSGGGGQPIHDGQELAESRSEKLYGLDAIADLRFSHENPSVQRLYKDFLVRPLSEKAHHLLHTDHTAWEMPLSPDNQKN